MLLKIIQLRRQSRTMSEQLLMIDTPYFYCGVILQAGQAVCAAPIVRYLLHWPCIRVEQYCRTRGWRYEVLDLAELSHASPG
jgi:hypothetical protein